MAKKLKVDIEETIQPIVETPNESVPPPADPVDTVKNEWCEMPHAKV